MHASAEVRWFHEGELPSVLRTWFDGVVGPTHVQARVDRYVRPTGPDGLNVKWREGGMEVKRLTEALGTEALAPGVEGRLERWRKWRFPLAEGGVLMDPDRDWVAVAKRRRVATLFVTADGTVRRAADGQWLEAGCGTEIGEMEVDGRLWWSVCLEAFGPERLATLRRVASHIFGEHTPEGLDAAHSQSYVGWLVGLRGEAARVPV